MRSLAYLSTIGLAAARVISLRARADDGMSICDYYATALLGASNATTQETLLTLLVNTAVIGNYSTVNVGVAVAGILAPGTYNGEAVNLLGYFDGALASTNNGGPCGASVNFLDGGGAAPLMKNLPAYRKMSNQYALLTHLYEYFATLLGCSEYGTTVSPYAGDPNMEEVHKYMGLDANQVGYFIEQVGLSAASFGVSMADITAVGTALNEYFNYRCLPPMSIPSYEPAYLQSICQACSCPVAQNQDCAAYPPAYNPAPAKSMKCGMSMTCPA